MVKPPKIRHSKPRQEPVTIELEPGQVSRIEEPQAADEPVDAAPSEPLTGEAADAQPAVSGAEASETAAGETAAAADVEENDSFFMGSEAPPEPASETPPVAEEERVSHAFGRDPDTPPPFGTARPETRASAESAIRPSATPERKSGSLSAMVAGIVGGVIALLGAGGLQFAGLLPSPGATVTAPAGDDEAISALKTEIAALKTDLDAVKAAPGGDTAKLSQSVADLASGVQGVSSALDEVKADVAALKSAVESGSAGDGAAVQALNAKLTELEASVTALGQGGQGVSQDVVDAINQKIAEVSAAASAAADASKAGEGRLAALEQSVAGLSDQIAKQAAQPKVALAIAAAALKSALERGGRSLPRSRRSRRSRRMRRNCRRCAHIAEKGVANRADLVAEADEAANAMIAAGGRRSTTNAGFFDRLLASAESLVKVRPIGAVEGAGRAGNGGAHGSRGQGRRLSPRRSPNTTRCRRRRRRRAQAFADKIKARLEVEEAGRPRRSPAR